MNTLSDLRSTLDDHAERVPDGEAVVRTAAVRHRVSVVRRRRRAAGAGAVCLVVLVGVAAAVVPRSTGDALPAAPTVLGVKAPTTQQALGYIYRTDGSSETFSGQGSVEMHPSTEPRLVSWTTERPTTVRLRLPDGDFWTSSVSGFRDSLVIPPGAGGVLRVSVPAGRVGLAMYDLTDVQPDGVTRDGVTFRRTVADTPLLASAIGAAGQRVVRTSLVGVRGQVRISVLCTGAPSDSMVHVAMAGSESTSGCDGTSFDPGANIVGTNDVGHVGRTVPVRVWVSGPRTSAPLPPGTADGVRIGVGLYGPAVSDRIAGVAMGDAIEYGGHTWHWSEGRVEHTPPLRFTGGVQPSLAVVGMRTGSGGVTRLRFHATGMPLEQSGFSGQGASSTGPYWIPAAAQVRVTRSTPGVLGMSVYVRTD